ncbi:MAG TPA: type II secretion system protein [Planctomycetota bacterium]|nr:type II secretion system protein [Planctomycetota bacterium]HRR81097.1 type II secretion system protein [Planctomycetota bacterium]HRT93473.1 type II secretion system protein [Planctomycetota bacterium]
MTAGRKRAFTLIELLVVMGVIAVLTTLLLPALHRARASTHALGCKANLSQLGQALALYLEDWDGFIPRRGQGEQKLAVINRMSDWFNCLPPYAGLPPYWQMAVEGRRPREGEHSVLVCPMATDPGWLYFLPYAMNIYVSPWIRPAPHRLSEMPYPSQTVFMADAHGAYSATAPSKKEYSVVARHQGKANLVFLDHHVESFQGVYVGCGVGDPRRSDVRWETGTGGINQPPLP